MGDGLFVYDGLTDFWRKVPRIYKDTFFVHKAYPLEYWKRQSVSPSVRQSISPSVIGICNPFLNSPQVLGLFFKWIDIYVFGIDTVSFLLYSSYT